jgi:hypothetical protein
VTTETQRTQRTTKAREFFGPQTSETSAPLWSQPCPESIREAAARREEKARVEAVKAQCERGERQPRHVIFPPAERAVRPGHARACASCQRFTRQGGACPGVVSHSGQSPACHSGQEILWRLEAPRTIAEAEAAGEAEGARHRDAENAEREEGTRDSALGTRAAETAGAA